MNGTIIKNSRNTESAPIDSASSQTVAFSHYNNISAQLPVDPKTGEIIAGEAKEQAKQCLKNIKAIAESIGHVMEDVVKINIYLIDISDIDIVDDVYATFFDGYLPARTTIAVKALPMAALVQIDAVISNGEGTSPQEPCDLQKVAKNTENAPRSSMSTQTVSFSHYNNVSAQLPVDPKTGEIVAGDIKAQAGQCLKNIKKILEDIDVPIDDIVKINIFLRNLADIEPVDEVYTKFFPDSAVARAVAYMPARTTVVASALPMNALVQVDAVVSYGDGTPPQEIEDRHGIVISARDTNNAPKSPLHKQTVCFSHYNHIAAQLPLDPRTGRVTVGDVKAQTERCLNNIKAIIESIDHVMDDVVKINMQLRCIEDIDAVNEVYTTFFNGDLPARTVLGVTAIPLDALVQIDAIVSNAEGTPPRL